MPDNGEKSQIDLLLEKTTEIKNRVDKYGNKIDGSKGVLDYLQDAYKKVEYSADLLSIVYTLTKSIRYKEITPQLVSTIANLYGKKIEQDGGNKIVSEYLQNLNLKGAVKSALDNTKYVPLLEQLEKRSVGTEVNTIQTALYDTSHNDDKQKLDIIYNKKEPIYDPPMLENKKYNTLISGLVDPIETAFAFLEFGGEAISGTTPLSLNPVTLNEELLKATGDDIKNQGTSIQGSIKYETKEQELIESSLKTYNLAYGTIKQIMSDSEVKREKLKNRTTKDTPRKEIKDIIKETTIGSVTSSIQEMARNAAAEEAEAGKRDTDNFKRLTSLDYLLAIDSIGKFAVGTPYIPNDMIALVHEGEMIVPKSQNPYAGANKIKAAINANSADKTAAASNRVNNVTYTFNSPKALGMSDVLREMRLAEQRKVLLGV